MEWLSTGCGYRCTSPFPWSSFLTGKEKAFLVLNIWKNIEQGSHQRYRVGWSRKWLFLLAALQRKSDLCAPRKETVLSPNLHIHVSVRDLYIPNIGPPIFLRQNKQTDCRNIKIAHRKMNVAIGDVAAQFFSFLGILVLNFRYIVFVARCHCDHCSTREGCDHWCQYQVVHLQLQIFSRILIKTKRQFWNYRGTKGG